MTQTVDTPPPSQIPLIGTLGMADIFAALKAGIYDFRRAPQFGLFFSAVYVVIGFGLITLGAGHVSWVLATSLGFPLAAPFAAVGLYEVSRRLETGSRWCGRTCSAWSGRNAPAKSRGWARSS